MMNTTRGTAASSLALGLAVTAGLVGCSSAPVRTPPENTGGTRLVGFNSCEQALRELRTAAEPYVGRYGFGTGARSGVPEGDTAGSRADAPAGAGAPGEKTTVPEHSGTNNHEAGVDEPDLVKTDGRRIVTVVNGSLTVVDVAHREVTGALGLASESASQTGSGNLLLRGDRALVIVPGVPVAAPERHDRPNVDGEDVPRYRAMGTVVLLVDISGTPQVMSRMTLDGEYVDARMVAGQVRLVTRTVPRVPFKPHPDPDRAARENRTALAESTIDDWLPRYVIETGGTVVAGRVGCQHVSRPATYTGTSMLTVTSLPMEAKGLTGEDSVSIVADGRTVYGTGDHMYVANDQRAVPAIEGGARPDATRRPRTEIFEFDVSRPGVPKHVASGAVPGWLLNQYAMSEHDGYLRVATTAGPQRPGIVNGRSSTESAVYVLKHVGRRLTRVGHVGGLGEGERIFSARFVGPVGFLVTFRQIDPLYVLDLRNPKHPEVRGELKITGYSAYLHPAGAKRLIGVGQEASKEGRRDGLQVSLFDVSDPAAPARLARHHLRGATSTTEFNPHAFLYWSKMGLLVIPMSRYQDEPGGSGKPSGFQGGALVLKVSGESLTEVGTVAHPVGAYASMVQRSMVIGDSLWTLSSGGLQANDATTLRKRAWIPFG